jgi:hypothetical protein
VELLIKARQAREGGTHLNSPAAYLAEASDRWAFLMMAPMAALFYEF